MRATEHGAGLRLQRDRGASGPAGIPDPVAGLSTMPAAARSTLNAIDGAITSNMAIVPNSDGSTDAFASNLTQLILDISSYFAP